MINSNKKISVIVPVYNSEKYLAPCLDSLVSQTYKNLEIILVNDGSADGSEDICRKYADSYESVTLINQENRGASSARNAGIAAATGDYIGFVDADDLTLPDMYEYLLSSALTEDADVVQCAFFYEDDSGSVPFCAPEKKLALHGTDGKGRPAFFKNFANAAWCKIYKRELVESIRFRPEYPIGEDLRFNLDCLSEAKTVILLPEAKYRYVQREGSICYTVNDENKLMSFHNMLLEAEKDFAPYPPLTGFIKDSLLSNLTDVGSKAVNLGFPNARAILLGLRKEIRHRLSFLLFKSKITKKQKAKLLLLFLSVSLYARAVRKNKE